MPTITNADIKLLRQLSDKKYRSSLGLFTVEGEKMVEEAVASGFRLRRLFRRDEIGEDMMKRISLQTSPSPVLAIVEQPSAPPETDYSKLCLGLDSVRDPGNLGTILRLADWFGVDTVFCSPDCVELYNPKVVQATMGAIFRKKVIYSPLTEVCDAFLARGLKVYGTFLDGESIYGAALGSTGLLVLGNEADGISDGIRAKVSASLTIPSFAEGPGAESLNVAVAAAVALSEFRRRI